MHTLLTALALFVVAAIIAGFAVFAYSMATAISEEDLYKTASDSDEQNKETETTKGATR